MRRVTPARADSEPAVAPTTDLLALAPAYILVCDPDGRVSAFNEACETFSRLRATDVVGVSLIDLLNRLNILDARALEAFWRRYVGAAATSGCVEMRCIGPDGDLRTLRCRLRTVPDPEGTPRSIIVVAHDISADRAHVSSLRERAETDALTGLLTRSALESALESATGDERRGGHVLFVDLDDFKSVNDEFGHASGDLVLAEIATRLRGTVRRDDLVSRLGGDEFVVFCPDTAVEAVAELVGRLRRVIGEPIVLGAGIVEVPASIGAAPVAPGIDWRESLAMADRDMYANKAPRTPRRPHVTRRSLPTRVGRR